MSDTSPQPAPSDQTNVDRLESAVANLSLQTTVVGRGSSSPDPNSLQPSPSPPSSSSSGQSSSTTEGRSSSNSQGKYVPPWKRQQQQQQAHDYGSSNQHEKPRQAVRTPAKSDSSASNLSNLSPYLIFPESSSSKSITSQSSSSPSVVNSSSPSAAIDAPASASRSETSQNSKVSKPASSTAVATSSSTPSKGLVLDRDRQAAIDAEFIAKGLDIGFQPSNSASGSTSSVPLSQVLEAYDVPSDITSSELLESLGSGAISIHPITSDSYLIVFERPTQADRACTMFNRVKQEFKLVNSERASRTALKVAETIAAPSVSRPKTDNRVANRLLAGALGLRLPRRSEEERAAERARREERQKKMAEDKIAQANTPSSQPDAWDS